MQYTKLGKTGIRVSRLCLGTMSFGWLIKEEAVVEKEVSYLEELYQPRALTGHYAGQAMPGDSQE